MNQGPAEAGAIRPTCRVEMPRRKAYITTVAASVAATKGPPYAGGNVLVGAAPSDASPESFNLIVN